MDESSQHTGQLAEAALTALLRQKMSLDPTPLGRMLYESMFGAEISEEQKTARKAMINAYALAILAAIGGNELPEAVFAPEAMPSALPATAPEFYPARRDRNESPVGFVRRVWKPWLDAGVLHQFQLATLDPELLTALKSFCQKRNLKVSQFVPGKSEFVRKREGGAALPQSRGD